MRTVQSQIIYDSVNTGFTYDVFVDVTKIEKEIRKKYFTDAKRIKYKQSIMKTNSLIVNMAAMDIAENKSEEDANDFLNNAVCFMSPTPTGVIIEVSESTAMDEESNKLFTLFKSVGKWFVNNETNLNLTETEKWLDDYDCILSKAAAGTLGLYGKIKWYNDIWKYNDKNTCERISNIFILFSPGKIYTPVKDKTVLPLVLLTMNILTTIFGSEKTDKFNLIYGSGMAIDTLYETSVLSDRINRFIPILKSTDLEGSLVSLFLQRDDGSIKLLEFFNRTQVNESGLVGCLDEYLTRPKYNDNTVRKYLKKVTVTSGSPQKISIGEYTFYMCEKLTDFILGKNITVSDIGFCAFLGSGLKSIHLKNGLVDLGSCSLASNNLQELILPKSISNSDTMYSIVGRSIRRIRIQSDCPVLNTIIRNNNYGMTQLDELEISNIRVDRKDCLVNNCKIDTLRIKSISEALRQRLILDEELSNNATAGMFKDCKIWRLEFSVDLTRQMIRLFTGDQVLIKKIFDYLFNNCDIHEVFLPMDHVIIPAGISDSDDENTKRSIELIIAKKFTEYVIQCINRNPSALFSETYKNNTITW